VFRDGF
jgi:hypothetical protein